MDYATLFITLRQQTFDLILRKQFEPGTNQKLRSASASEPKAIAAYRANSFVDALACPSADAEGTDTTDRRI